MKKAFLFPQELRIWKRQPKLESFYDYFKNELDFEFVIEDAASRQAREEDHGI